MTYVTLKVAHLFGVVMALSSLAALALKSAEGDAAPAQRKLALMTHGIGLLLALGGGVGMILALGLSIGDNLWLFGKLGIWLVVGALVSIPRKKPEWGLLVWWAVPTLAGLAVWLVSRPF